jgi:hypothetical protein
MKYELTSNTPKKGDVTLYQIKALKSFGDIKSGELGGFIEKESNLDQSGNAWVFGNAQISGNAKVYGNAEVSGNAKVYGNAMIFGSAWVSGTAKVSEPTHIFACGPIGSRNATTTFYRVRGNKIDVLCGCFWGSIDEFEQAVVREHKGTKHKKAYLAAIKLAKMQIELEVGVDKEGE